MSDLNENKGNDTGDHAYSVEEAESLLADLHLGDDVRRQAMAKTRQNPWQAWAQEDARISRHPSGKQEAESEVEHLRQANDAQNRPTQAAVDRANFKLGPGELGTLDKVLEQCVAYFADLYGIPRKYLPYLSVSDLVYDEIKLALAAAPKALRPVAIQALRALTRGELLGTLVDSREQSVLGPRAAKAALNGWTSHSRDLGDGTFYVVPNETQERLRALVREVEGNTFYTGTRRVYPCDNHVLTREPTSSDLNRALVLDGEMIGAVYKGLHLSGAMLHNTKLALDTACLTKSAQWLPVSKTKFLACRGRLTNVPMSECLLVDFNGTISESRISNTTISGLQGAIQASELEEVELKAGNGFSMETCFFGGGRCHIEDGAKFNGVEFSGTAFELPDIAANGPVIFQNCNFRNLKLGQELLATIARRSSGCFFTSAQLNMLRAAGINLKKIRAQNGEKNRKELKAIMVEDGRYLLSGDGDNWRSLLRFPARGLAADMLDEERHALPGVPPSPILSGAHLNAGLDIRLMARPLASRDIRELPKRIAAYTALARLMRDKSDANTITPKAWMEFFHSVGTKVCQKHFGIPPSLLSQNPMFWDQVPEPDTLAGMRGDPTNLAPIYSSSPDPQTGKVQHSRMRIDDARKARPLMDRDGKCITDWAIYQQMKVLAKILFQKIHALGTYICELQDQGACFPSLDEGGQGFECDGLVHPDIQARLKGSAVANNVKLPDGGVLNFSSAGNGDGKSSIQAALALALIQAQSGLPVHAQRARLHPNHGYDYVLVLPNTRAEAGQGHGVMYERAAQYKNLLERMKALAVTQGRQARVLVLMDEVSMGGTNYADALAVDTHTVLELARLQGLHVTIIAIVQDAAEIVPAWVKRLGADKVTLMTHTAASPQYSFTEATKAVSSNPGDVLAQLGLGHLINPTYSGGTATGSGT